MDEGKDISQTNGKSALPQDNETNGEVLLPNQQDLPSSQENNEQNPLPQTNGTNGTLLLVKEEAISKENNPKQQIVVAKKRGGLHLLKVALFMLLRRSGKKSKPIQVEVASKGGLWRKILGSVRPLQLQHQQPQEETPPPPLLPASPAAGLNTSLSIENFQEMLSSTMSPQTPYSQSCSPSPDSSSSSSSSANSSIDSLSSYASAQSLQELGQRTGCHCDDEIEEEIVEDGDEMIDAKAEEFISHFYEQMRLQRLDTKCYN